MSLRPTPETDAAFAKGMSATETYHMLQRLERQRDDYKEALEIASRSADDQMDQKREAERLRDEAMASEASETRWAAKYKRERDEAREQLAQCSTEREHNAMMALAFESDCKMLAEVIKTVLFHAPASGPLWHGSASMEACRAALAKLNQTPTPH